MKYYQSIFLLLIAPFFLSHLFKQTKPNHAEAIGTMAHVNDHLKGSGLSAYEVRFTFTGHTSFGGTLSDCPVRSNGTVKLTGLLEGAENVSSDDDVSYTGILQLNIDMDICSIKPGDPDKFCSITVTGSGPVKTELEIYYDGRGGYIQIKDTTSRGFTKNVAGTCDLQQIAEERGMVPLKTIASVFNGLELPMLTQRTLRVGSDSSRTADGKLVIEVLRRIRP
jgi:hypothetical protein